MSFDRSADTEAMPAVREDPTADRGRILAWLITGQVLAALTLVPWLVMAVVTTVAAGAEGGVGAWLFTVLVWAYPAWPVGFSVAAWSYWRRRRGAWAGLLMLCAALPGLVVLLLMALSAL